jgi:hypothetical protein
MALRLDVVEAAGARSSERSRAWADSSKRASEPDLPPRARGEFADYVQRLELDLSVALDDAEQIYQGWKEHTDELRQDVKEKEEQASGILELLEFEQSKGRESKLLIADAERRETQLEMLRGQLSEELGQKAQMEEALQCSQLQAATALSELEEEQRKANRLGQQIREREGTIRGLQESQTSGGLDVTQRSLTITREEEWQSLLDERTIADNYQGGGVAVPAR